MIKQISKTALISLSIGFLAELFNVWLATDFLQRFFEINLITTMGIVLTKIRDLVDKNGGSEFFQKTRKNMLLSVKEQIGLIILATLVLSVKTSPIVAGVENLPLLLNAIVAGIFAYALLVLYDTAKGVLIIVDFNG
jgi:hypothetical protein